MSLDSFATRAQLAVNGKSYTYFSLPRLGARFDLSKLPYSMKILLENLLRHEDGGMTVGKLDNDVTDDIAVTDQTTRSVLIFSTAPVRDQLKECARIGSSFTPTVSTIPLPAGQVPRAIVAVDLDGDRDGDVLQDLVVVGSSQVILLWNNGNNTFETRTLADGIASGQRILMGQALMRVPS